MKTILLADGYVKYPDHWVAVKNMEPKDANYCGVLQFKNGPKYGVPTFLFFLKNKTINEMNTDDEQQVFYACEKKFPEFFSILNSQVKPKRSPDGTLLNSKEWDDAPTIGWFHVFDAEDDYGLFDDALIYRKSYHE